MLELGLRKFSRQITWVSGTRLPLTSDDHASQQIQQILLDDTLYKQNLEFSYRTKQTLGLNEVHQFFHH